MKVWTNTEIGKYPLKLSSPVRVRFRDGTFSRHDATVGDHHGCGDENSNWFSAGEPEDIVEYEQVAA